MRRDLFVFAGQSNMMGASVYPPKYDLFTKHSYEYKHKMRRLGNPAGAFVPVGYPVGEFSYIDIHSAYASDMVNEQGKSLLRNYVENTYFCPSMSNLKSEADKTVFPFAIFSEADAPMGATLAPFVAQEWEKAGHTCAYAHIAKGGVSIDYFFTDDMVREYEKRVAQWNRAHGTNLNANIPDTRRMNGAADYFFEKCADFFSDAEVTFTEDAISSRCFFWLQGESDTKLSVKEYEIKLEILWDTLQNAGFTHFFCLRVDFFGSTDIDRIMYAQERFVENTENAYMLSRAASYFLYSGRSEKEWLSIQPDEEYQLCRDSFFGYPNQHINEKGFLLLARRAAENLIRILIRGETPILEEEYVQTLRDHILDF